MVFSVLQLCSDAIKSWKTLKTSWHSGAPSTRVLEYVLEYSSIMDSL